MRDPSPQNPSRHPRILYLSLSLSLSLWSHEIVADGLNNSQLLFVAWDVDVLGLACRETLPWSAHTDESSYERVTWVCL